MAHAFWLIGQAEAYYRMLSVQQKKVMPAFAAFFSMHKRSAMIASEHYSCALIEK
jgi:hypothetical protein